VPFPDRVADARSLTRGEAVDRGGLRRSERAVSFDFSRIRIDDPAARNRSVREVGTVAPPIVHRVLASPGEPLAVQERQKFETGLGRSLAQVRVHRDAVAAESANAVDAAAYAIGPHIVMGSAHAPGSRAYEWTLAHELTHVAQQHGRRAGTTIPIGALGSRHERDADQAADQLVRGARVPPQTTVPLELSRQPRLTIVDVDSGLDEKQLAVIVVEAKKALGQVTKRSTDKRVKAGVEVSYRHGLKDIETLVKRGDVLVYLIGAEKGQKSIPQPRMEKIVHDIVAAQRLPDPKMDERAKRLAGDLRETVDLKTGAVTGRSQYDPATSVSIVNIDLIPNRDAGGLRAIAGDILHEGPGHRALPRGYHNPEGKGVMSEHVRDSATEEQILFQSDEWDAVNAFLKSVVDDPKWNK
jgi:uncharacterized protein DUF4157